MYYSFAGQSVLGLHRFLLMNIFVVLVIYKRHKVGFSYGSSHKQSQAF